MGRPRGRHARSVSVNARYRAWQSMRILRRFTLPDLVATAEINNNNAQKYVDALSKGGYLRLVKPRASGVKGGHAVWQLVKNTGPNPPRIWSNGRIWDPNTGEEVDDE